VYALSLDYVEKKIEIIKEVVLSPNGLFIINPIMHPLNSCIWTIIS
jgi:hypothetical protein